MSSGNGERGSVVLMTAVLLPALLLVVGLGIDFGLMYSVRNSAQNAADAAAMAGVYEFTCGQTGNCPQQLPPYTSDTSGNTAAQNAFAANPFLGSASATLTPTPGGYQCTDANGNQNYCYKVTVTTSSPVFFSKIFGKQPVPITVVATAMDNDGAIAGVVPSCVRPVFVPDGAIPCTYSGGTLSCPPGPVTLQNIRATSPCPNGQTSCSSCSGSGCYSGSVTPSTYYSLDFSSLLQDITNPNSPPTPQNLLSATNPVVFSDGSMVDNSGQGPNSPYAQAWYKCTVTALHCGQYVRVQTGISPNTTTNSVQQLLNSTNNGMVFTFPLWDSSQAVVNGNNLWIQVIGWAQVTGLQCINPTTNAVDSTCQTGDSLQATYQSASACTTAPNGGSNSANSPYEIPIQLVQ